MRRQADKPLFFPGGQNKEIPCASLLPFLRFSFMAREWKKEEEGKGEEGREWFRWDETGKEDGD